MSIHTILQRYSDTPGHVPGVGDIEFRELAVNTFDTRVFLSRNNSSWPGEINEIPVTKSFYNGTIHDWSGKTSYTTTQVILPDRVDSDYVVGQIMLLSDGVSESVIVTITYSAWAIKETIIEWTPAISFEPMIATTGLLASRGLILTNDAYVFEAGSYSKLARTSEVTDPTGLEAVYDHPTLPVLGWRLVGRDPLNYGNCGRGSVDFSESSSPSTTKGTTGTFSLAAGQDIIASSNYMFAGGKTVDANAFCGIAWGLDIDVAGQYGQTFGKNLINNADHATVLGEENNTLGEHSFVFGFENSCSGHGSFIGGRAVGAIGHGYVSGENSFMFQLNDSQLNYLAADNSVILGGTNNETAAAAINSCVLVGDNISATQANMVYLPGTKYRLLTSAQITSLPDSELGTFVFDSDLNQLMQCTDATSGANVWTSASTPLTYNADDKVYQFESGVSGVVNQLGLEDWLPVINNTGVTINNGKAVAISGIDGQYAEISLANNNDPASVGRTIGLLTSTLIDGEQGFVTERGYVRDFDTSGLNFFGPVYLGTNGNLTMTKPAFPAVPKIMGGLIKNDATTGIVNVGINDIQARQLLVKSYGFTSQGIGTGIYYKAGFYHFATADANLNQGNLTQTYGDPLIAYSAHAFLVCGGPGIVDTGVVGLKVSGTKIDDAGVQTPGFSETLIPDITAVALNEAVEGAKFIGTVTFELFVVSGTPVNYSLDINYGYAKYEDFGNRDFYFVGAECIWQGGATDLTGFDILVYHHSVTGWTYAATGFVPGGTILAQRSVDFAGFLKVSSDVDSAWKRVGLNTYINGSGAEGLIYRIDTGSNNTVQTMDMHFGIVFD